MSTSALKNDVTRLAGILVLAKVRITTSGFADPALRALLPAITRRVTTHTRFADTPVPKALCQELAQAAATEGAQARCIGKCTVRERIAELIAEADRLQFSDPRFRRELAQWLRPARHAEGMPLYASVADTMLALATPVSASIVRTFDVGNGVAAAHRELVRGSPRLILLVTDGIRTTRG
ncbi:hypothetical protein IHE31_09745 [Mycetohabitans rhizoxinica]|uniref:hypothetical protein n=1 Tax=Mycetohabitans rhizoxinica TaxID=412963 RepID=UPI0030CBF929